MDASHRYSTKRLAFLVLSTLLLRDGVSSYSTSAPSGWRPVHNVPGRIDPVASAWATVPENTVTTTSRNVPTSDAAIHSVSKRVSYDLGMGRNQPVRSATHKPAFINVDSRPVVIEEAAQYLFEHESVREYPSPLVAAINRETLKAQAAVAAAAKVGSPQKQSSSTSFPVLIPNRVTDDSVLKIVPSIHPAAEGKPCAVAQQSMTTSNQFDLNTAWIEMLIHEQQQKQQQQKQKLAATPPPSQQPQQQHVKYHHQHFRTVSGTAVVAA